MAPTAMEEGPISIAIQWLHGLWEYYREYTRSATHAAAVAALTIFGLLIFIDPIFAILAIASYICPPIALYVIGTDAETDTEQSDPSTIRAGSDRCPDSDLDTDPDSDDGDSDSDSDDGDTDSDTDGADEDTDTDTDTDR